MNAFSKLTCVFNNGPISNYGILGEILSMVISGYISYKSIDLYYKDSNIFMGIFKLLNHEFMKEIAHIYKIIGLYYGGKLLLPMD